MDELDLKIQNALSKNLDISDDFQRIYNAIEGFPEHYEKNKTSYMKKIIQFIKYIIIGTSLIGATVFAYNEIQKNEVKKEVEQKVSDVDEGVKIVEKEPDWYTIEIDKPLDWNDWKYPDTGSGCVYLKINTIEEYNLYKQKYIENFEMEEMTEEDFEKNFLFLINVGGDASVVDVKTDDTTLRIEIDRKMIVSDELDENKVISLKINNENDRELIEIIQYPIEEEFNLIPSVEEIAKNNYTKEELIEFGYTVVHWGISPLGGLYYIYDNKDKLDEFMTETQAGKEMELGIVWYESSEENIRIYNIKYENGYYFMYAYQKYTDSLGEIICTQYFYKGKEIKVEYNFEDHGLGQGYDCYTYKLEGELNSNRYFSPVEIGCVFAIDEHYRE